MTCSGSWCKAGTQNLPSRGLTSTISVFGSWKILSSPLSDARFESLQPKLSSDTWKTTALWWAAPSKGGGSYHSCNSVPDEATMCLS